MNRNLVSIAMATALAFALLATISVGAQTTMPSPMAPASAASGPKDGSNKAGKPPVDAAASSANAATKKPAKPGAQSGPASTPSAPAPK